MRVYPLLACFAFASLALTPAFSQYSTIWTLGTQDGEPNEFGNESWQQNASPGSATALDNDYYFAGTYGIGTFGTAEAPGNYERALSTSNHTNRIHFNLTAAQAVSTARIRLTFQHIWGGWSGLGYGTHQFEVRLNGALIGTKVHQVSGTVFVEANAGTFTPVIGENVIQITRTIGVPSSANGWIAFDSLSFEIHPLALQDADADGLPRWWEEDQGLNDNLAVDAAQDPDNDGLTNTQEFAKKTNAHDTDSDDDGLADGVETNTAIFVSATNTGTDPLNADTDGDSLLDGAEVTSSSASNPLLKDTDGDLANDAWEVTTGFNPASNTSKPPAPSSFVGIQFVSELNPQNALSPYAVTGRIPQPNWNATRPLSTWDSDDGTQADIASPTAGTLLNGNGAASGMTFSWHTPSSTWASGNSFTKLLDGYLNASESSPASVTVSNITYPVYDVIVYGGSLYDNAIAYVRLNNNSSTDTWFTTSSSSPQTQFIETPVSNSISPWRANSIRFRNVTGTSMTVSMAMRDWHAGGIHGIQIVNAQTDSDSDGLPDHWEFTNKLNPRSDTDAAADTDGDSLNNTSEYARRTDPRLADTDGDGLIDSKETGTGTWVSANNTGSNALLADTDGDRLPDGEEASRLPSPTNPNVTDSDGDGRSDYDEVGGGTDPLVADGLAANMPVVTISPRTFTWNVDNLQLVWDHTRGNPQASQDLLSLSISNTAASGTTAMYYTLPIRSSRITYMFHSNHTNAFSYPSNPNGDIWQGDWNTIPTYNFTAGLGFSGHGKYDISDRIRFQVSGTSTGAANAWNIQFKIINLDTNTTLYTLTQNNCTLASAVHNNTVTWHDYDDPVNNNRFRLQLMDGVQAYFQNTPLENTAAFAAYKDTDEDGMPDVWESLYSLNPASSTDATQDADSDGLSNRDEYLAGTNPRDNDSDDDGARDGVETLSGSNPLLASSLPPYYNGLPSGLTGEDLNGNGMSDAWELWAGDFSLSANADDDGDGISNYKESVAGTDPFDRSSKFWSEVFTQGSNLIVRWPRTAHKQYGVWYDEDMVAPWTLSLGTPSLVDDIYRQTFTNALLAGTKLFLKVDVKNLDTDSDGVSDWAEDNVLGSNPNQANSLHSSVTTASAGGGTATMSGDYVAMLQQFEGAAGSGGYAGGAASSGGGSSGGGGSGGTGSTPSTGISASQAARFLMQTSFGPTMEDIAAVQQAGYEGWITQQLTAPITLHSNYAKSIYLDLKTQQANLDFNYGGEGADTFLFGNNMMTAFARAAIQGEDQLRQRVAFALSQILVASRREAELENRVLGMSDFYDIFVRNSLGNYYDVLKEVTFHPVMGRYLSHVGNQKARPEINQYPDENYAREVMQLFTIGLWELNPDGSRRLDGQSQPIPTYSNTEITQTARVLTGLWFGGHYWANGGWSEESYTAPMTMHADYHDFGEKTLVRGYKIPARPQTNADAIRDIEDMLRNLFEHPNCAVFVGKQLIQFLVTDNPSPAYVQRVSSVFANNGQGVRGDLKAVIKAILLDDEARLLTHTASATHGRLKEPVNRAMAIGRAFGMKAAPKMLWWDWGEYFGSSRQEPTYSPSVFNFYRPDYQAPGLLTQNSLAGPVFQITDSYSSISYPNRLWYMMEDGFSYGETYRFPLDLSAAKALATTPEALVDNMNVLFCAGEMSLSSRQYILTAINQIAATETAARVRVAAYLAMVCPEGAIMR